MSVNISGRVQGVAKARYLEKRKVVQKPALTVLHVKTLEKIVLGGTSAEYSEFDRHCAGFFCYALYSRARFSDAQASANLTLDATEGDDGLYGFLEASVTRSKTSYTLERKTRFLPMVAPINGLLDEPWGVRWHRIMLELGVVLREGYPLLSAPTTGGGFSLLPMTAEYAARVLRELLRRELLVILLRFGSWGLIASSAPCCHGLPNTELSKVFELSWVTTARTAEPSWFMPETILAVL